MSQAPLSSRLPRALALLAAGRPGEAEALLLEAAREAPRNPQVHHLRAEAAMALGRLDAALGHAIASLAWERKRAEPHALAGWLLHRAGDSPLGARLLERALALDPANGQAQAWLDAVRAEPRTDATHPAWEVLGRPPRISLCMIARNEAAYLGRCLRAARPHVDELIVVDTGSTDATAAIAAAHGARVGRFAWCDDFAAARNASLALATGDWVLVLDADEVLEAPRGHLHALLDALPIPALTGTASLVSLRLHNHQHSLVGRDPWDVQLIHRFFPREAIHFVGQAHESPVLKPGLPLTLDVLAGNQVHVHHFGYRPELMRSRNKLARNTALLRARLAEHPEDHGVAYLLARELTAGEHWEEAVAMFRRYWASIPPGQEPFAFRLAWAFEAEALGSLGRGEEAIAILDRGLAADPDFPSTWFRKAEELAALGRYDEAVACYERAIANADYHERHALAMFNGFPPEQAGSLATQRLARARALARGETPDGPRPATAVQAHLADALAALSKGELAEAEAALGAADAAGPRHAQVPYLCAELAFRTCDLARALDHALAAIRLDGSRPEPWALAGWVLREQGDGEAAIGFLRRAVALDPAYGNARALLRQVEASPRGERAVQPARALLAGA